VEWKEVVKIELSEPTPSLNTTQKWHWGKRARYRKGLSHLVQRLVIEQWDARANREASTMSVRRRVVITRRSSGTLDHDNHVGGCKPLLDALVAVGLLVDDSPEWVEVEYRQARWKAVDRGDRAGTVVQVYEPMKG